MRVLFLSIVIMFTSIINAQKTIAKWCFLNEEKKTYHEKVLSINTDSIHILKNSYNKRQIDSIIYNYEKAPIFKIFNVDLNTMVIGDKFKIPFRNDSIEIYKILHCNSEEWNEDLSILFFYNINYGLLYIIENIYDSWGCKRFYYLQKYIYYDSYVYEYDFSEVINEIYKKVKSTPPPDVLWE